MVNIVEPHKRYPNQQKKLKARLVHRMIIHLRTTNKSLIGIESKFLKYLKFTNKQLKKKKLQIFFFMATLVEHSWWLATHQIF